MRAVVVGFGVCLMVLGCGPLPGGAPGNVDAPGAKPPVEAKDSAGPPVAEVPLTEDQKIAWAKLRRQHPQNSCFIAGYVTVVKAWRLQSDYLNGTYLPGWRMDLGGIIYDETVSDPNPALAKAQSDARSIPGYIAQAERNLGMYRHQSAESPTRADLAASVKRTESEIADMRKELADAKAVAAAALKVPPAVEAASKRAAVNAQRFATEPDIKAAALVDLFGGPEPKVLKWFVDDGKGAKELKAAPSVELESGLKDFLHRLQVQADSL